MQFFEQKGLSGIDLSIYRIGINKFRMPFTKKSPTDLLSLSVPDNYDTKETFHKHLVTYTKNCDFLDLQIENFLEYEHRTKNEEEIIKHKIIQNEQKSNNEIEQIINSYKIISKKAGFGKQKNCIFYDLGTLECDGMHENNHNYLIHNTHTNTLKLKCHSKKCVDFEKKLYTEKSATLHFSYDYCRNIPIKKNEPDNYYQLKKYIEQFFICIKDTNSYYRKKFEYNQKYKYFEKQIKAINIQGYTKDIFYKELKDDEDDNKKKDKNEEQQELKYKQRNFFKRYEIDPYKKSYLGLCFQPYGNTELETKIRNGDYNLFDGFNYANVLTFSQKKNIPDEKEENFQFFLTYVKEYICGMHKAKKSKSEKLIKQSEKLFEFLMHFFGNIIQEPTIVTHLILVFFSKTHGTGKSGFTKFISNVIGPNLSYFGSFEQIVEKHTHAHVAKLINVIEEIDQYNSKKYYNKMKDFSQREVAIYNEKNKPQDYIRTFVRYIQTTNYTDGAYFDSEDRRHVVYTFDKIDDEEKIKKIADIMEDPFTIYLFGKYLETVEIGYTKRTEWQNNRPLTEDYFTMRAENVIILFLKDLLKLDGISVEYLENDDYFKVCAVDKKETNKNLIAISKESFYSLFLKFYTENNCIDKNYKTKLKFINNIKINYRNNEIKIRKFTKINKKDYFVIDLFKLWTKLFPKQKFINYHDEDEVNKYYATLQETKKNQSQKLKISKEENTQNIKNQQKNSIKQYF